MEAIVRVISELDAPARIVDLEAVQRSSSHYRSSSS